MSSTSPSAHPDSGETEARSSVEAATLPQVNIRTCKKADLAVVRAFRQEFIAETHEQTPDEDGTPRALNEYSLIAETDGSPVGYLLAEAQTTELSQTEIGQVLFPDDTRYLEIQELYVEPRHREHGIGTRLLQTVLQRARANEISRSMARTVGEDPVGKTRLYERCGYRVSHVCMTQ